VEGTQALVKLEVNELNPGFGVEVSGVEPRVPLDERTVAELRRLFDDKGLIVIRELDADLAFQNYLSQLLIGDDQAASKAPAREMFVSNKRENGNAPYGQLLFHSDRMWSPEVFRLLSLYGVEVTQPSIPTLFVSARNAWKTLPEDLRAEVDGRFAVHGHHGAYENRARDDGEVLVSNFEKDETVKLPIGFAHPRTGETILYLSEMFTQRIDGMPHDEGEALLRRLFDHLYREDNVITHLWRKGDLVLWDNIALQHARPNVRLEGPPRTLRKVFGPPPQITLAQRPKVQNL
jgi:taurine dioxygenase